MGDGARYTKAWDYSSRSFHVAATKILCIAHVAAMQEPRTLQNECGGNVGTRGPYIWKDASWQSFVSADADHTSIGIRPSGSGKGELK